MNQLVEYRENNSIIDQLILTILENINSVKKKIKKHESLVFTIGNTAFSTTNNVPYITPIRKSKDVYTLGVIVYTQFQASVISKIVDGKVDFIFVDCEKKLPGIVNPDYSLIKKYDLQIPNNAKNSIEYGNISSVCISIIKKTQVFTYKANDLTVDVSWLFLSTYFKDMSGKKIVIIGPGNIGLKLSLKIVESAADVYMCAKNIQKIDIINSLNKIKQDSVMSKIHFSDNPIEVTKDANAIIGCTNSQQVINAEMVNAMDNKGIIIDIGKGNLTKDGLDAAGKRGINAWRADISPMLRSMINSSIEMSEFKKNSYGASNKFTDFMVVSGGYIGNRYDIIVDKYKKIRFIIGVCDGSGSIMVKLDHRAEENLKVVKKSLNVDDQ